MEAAQGPVTRLRVGTWPTPRCEQLLGVGADDWADYDGSMSAPHSGSAPISKTNPGVGGTQMNWDQIEGTWKQIRGKAREQWGKLTDDDLDVVAGRRDALIGKVQERYGIAREEAERQVHDWSDRMTIH